MSARSWHLETPFYRSFPSSISLLPLLPPFFPLPPSALPLPLSLFLSFPPSPGALISLPLRAHCSLSLGDHSPSSLSGRIDLLSGRINLPPSPSALISLSLSLSLFLPPNSLLPPFFSLSLSFFLPLPLPLSLPPTLSLSAHSQARTLCSTPITV